MTRFKSLAWCKRNRGGHNSGSPAPVFPAYPDIEQVGVENDPQTSGFRVQPVTRMREPASRLAAKAWSSRIN